MADWRKSKKANELREFIDKVFKPRKPSIKNLDRELIIDFVAKEIASSPRATYCHPPHTPAA
jgi:hypothetical protein